MTSTLTIYGQRAVGYFDLTRFRGRLTCPIPGADVGRPK